MSWSLQAQRARWGYGGGSRASQSRRRCSTVAAASRAAAMAAGEKACASECDVAKMARRGADGVTAGNFHEKPFKNGVDELVGRLCRV